MSSAALENAQSIYIIEELDSNSFEAGNESFSRALHCTQPAQLALQLGIHVWLTYPALSSISDLFKLHCTMCNIKNMPIQKDNQSKAA